MLMRFYETMGVPRQNMRLLINSMGERACRPAYREIVRAFILDHSTKCAKSVVVVRKPTRCVRSTARTKRAPTSWRPPRRSLTICATIAGTHYEAVKGLCLTLPGISYIEDPTLVRGLDYYTRTVFEVQVTEGMGSQSAIGGGGRYDKLAES